MPKVSLADKYDGVGPESVALARGHSEAKDESLNFAMKNNSKKEKRPSRGEPYNSFGARAGTAMCLETVTARRIKFY
ncbi:hypothetical protein [Undibacterium sp. Ren11W]|uniref:hypothetical protein n=1 Tax=Undibacterium sp. Ren11W TaxID=3413045 RepID=UPI003BF41A15